MGREDALTFALHPRLDGDAGKDNGVRYGDKLDEEVLKMYQEELQAADSLGVGPLGSGSDYTVFLQRIGVASSNGGFGSTLSDPVYHYHSVFDSQVWQERYVDPGFHRHVRLIVRLRRIASSSRRCCRSLLRSISASLLCA